MKLGLMLNHHCWTYPCQADSEKDYIANDEDVDKDLPGEVPNFIGEAIDYINFLGIDNILNSPHDDYGEFYADEENHMFTRKSVVDPFLSIFTARGREKERQRHGKAEVLPSVVWGVQGSSMMRSVTLILGSCLILVLRKSDWNELTGHPKDRGRNRLNSRTNSLQPGEDDVDHIASKFMKTNRSDVSIKTPRKMATRLQDRGRPSRRPLAGPDL
jgi:hypothetical protein